MVWAELTFSSNLPTIPPNEEVDGHPPDLLVPAHRAVAVHGRCSRAPVRVRSGLPGVPASNWRWPRTMSRRSLPNDGDRSVPPKPGWRSLRVRSLRQYARSRDHPQRHPRHAPDRGERPVARSDSELLGSRTHRSRSAPADLIPPFSPATLPLAFLCARGSHPASSADNAHGKSAAFVVRSTFIEVWTHEETPSDACSLLWSDLRSGRGMRHS